MWVTGIFFLLYRFFLPSKIRVYTCKNQILDVKNVFLPVIIEFLLFTMSILDKKNEFVIEADKPYTRVGNVTSLVLERITFYIVEKIMCTRTNGCLELF